MPKSIMIVGAGPGIGQAVARRFGREGWRVVLSGRSAERLNALTAVLAAAGIVAHSVVVDASDAASLRGAMAGAARLTGGLTAVHFNAAVVRQQDLFSMLDDEILGDLATNVGAGLHTIRSAAAQFGDRGGTILVTGGGLGITPHAGYASLGAGKAAMRNVVQGLAGPLAGQGIRIGTVTVATLVSPGSPEARDVAEAFWHMATDAEAPWEIVYPALQVPLTLIARLTARPEHAEALGEGLRALIAPTATEPGSLGYTLHRDNDNPSVWVLYEIWRSRADLDAHFEQPYTKAMLARFPELLAKEMELTFCTRTPA